MLLAPLSLWPLYPFLSSGANTTAVAITSNNPKTNTSEKKPLPEAVTLRLQTAKIAISIAIGPRKASQTNTQPIRRYFFCPCVSGSSLFNGSFGTSERPCSGSRANLAVRMTYCCADQATLNLSRIVGSGVACPHEPRSGTQGRNACSSSSRANCSETEIFAPIPRMPPEVLAIERARPRISSAS